MPHLLTLTPSDNETRVSLHTGGAVNCSNVVPNADTQDLITRADALLARNNQELPTANDLLSLGEDLADALLGALTQDLLALRGTLWIVSTDPDLLNLPFELIPRADGAFLIEGGHLLLRRATDAAAAIAAVPPVTRPGPLRVLFMACAPAGSDQLSFEMEQEAIERLCIQVGPDVHLDTEFSGTLAGLTKKIQTFRPHLVHLSGHASMGSNGIGCFLFEDEFGNPDPVPASKIATEALTHSGVGMVFFSGCETARSGIAGVCQAVVDSGHVSLALGWGESVADDLATRFGIALLTSLGAGEKVDVAIDRARTAVLTHSVIRDEHGAEYLRPDFALPRLYASGPVDRIHDPSAPEDKPKSTPFVRRPMEDGITSLVAGFIGRRRILQRTFPVLRDGVGGHRALLLTGIGGAGKSSLASHIIDEFRTNPAWHIIALKLQESETPTAFGTRIARTVREAAQLIPGFNPLLIHQLGEDRNEPDATEDLCRRLRFVVQALNDHPILLYLDNLESLMPLPPAEPVWSDPAFHQFFNTLVTRLTGKGRAILTCRYIPASLAPERAPHLLHESMPDFTLAEFKRYLFYDEALRLRMLTGELPDDLITEFHAKFGATPGFLNQIIAVLQGQSEAAIRGSLAKIGNDAFANATDDTSDEILGKQQQYFADIFLSGLYTALTPAHRAALSRFAVSDLALPLDGVAAIAAVSETDAGAALAAWLRLGLVQCFTDRDGPPLYAVYPLQRAFLTADDRLPAVSRMESHRALATWLRACSEADREDDLDMHFMDVFCVCLYHARAAVSHDLAAWSAKMIAIQLMEKSEFQFIRRLGEDMMRDSRHPDILKFTADALESLGKWSQARELLEEAVSGFQAVGNRATEASAWHQLASIDIKEGNYSSARERFSKSIEIKRAIGDRAGEAATWHGLGTIDLEEGNFAAAREKFSKSLETRQGNPAGEAATWHQLATIDIHEGDYPAARKKLRRSLEIKQLIGNRAGAAATWHALGTLSFNEEDYGAARRSYATALEIEQNLGIRAGEGATWAGLALTSSRLAGPAMHSLHLAIVAWNILKDIGSVDQKPAFKNLTDMASDLSLSPNQLATEIQAALASYQADRGAALLAAAFPDAGAD